MGRSVPVVSDFTKSLTWDPDVGIVIWKIETWRHDPNHGGLGPKGLEVSSPQVWIPPQLVLPETVTDDHNRAYSRHMFIGGKTSSRFRRKAQCGKKILTHAGHTDQRRLIPPKYRRGAGLIAGEVLKGRRLILPIPEIWAGDLHCTASGIQLLYGDEFIGVGVGEGRQNHLADYRKNGSIRPDSQRQRRDRYGRKPCTFSQSSHGELHVLPNTIEKKCSAHCPVLCGSFPMALLLECLQVSEESLGFESRVGGVPSFPLELFRTNCDVRFEFPSDVFFNRELPDLRQGLAGGPLVEGPLQNLRSLLKR